MDDFWKTLWWGGLGLYFVQGGMKPWAERSAVRQVRESFHKGELTAKVSSRGMLGMLVSDIYSVDIYGSGVHVDKIPFDLHPKEGWKGRIRHLRLHLTDFQMAGLPVSRMEGDIPFAKYDLGYAFNKQRLYLRSAEAGTASVYLTAENALVFVQRKFKENLQDGRVFLINDRVIMMGKIRLFGGMQPFYAEARVAVRGGRYIDLVEPTVFLSDTLLPPPVAKNILKQLNPVIDTDIDLRLKGLFEPQKIAINDGTVRVEGKLTVPLAEPSPQPPSIERVSP